MSSHTLDQVLDDVLREKGALVRGELPNKADYQQVWDAFNRYVTATLAKRRTLDVPNFCKIGWKIEQHQDKAKQRPHFQLADSFIRVHHLEPNRHGLTPDNQFTPIEELNYSKVAIKYSQGLTKASMFAGLRAMVQKIGEACARRQVCIDFELGQLLCTERVVSFAFVGELYQQEGLEVPKSAITEATYQPSRTFAPPTTEGLNLKIQGTARAAREVVPSSPGAASSRDQQPQDVVARIRLRPVLDHPWLFDQDVATDGESESAAAAVEGDATSAGSPRSSAQECVRHNALVRHMHHVKSTAEEAIRLRNQEQEYKKVCEEMEVKTEESRRGFYLDHQEELKRQMRQAEEKRLAARESAVSQGLHHDFPCFRGNSKIDICNSIGERKRCLKEDLDQQVAQKRDDKKAVVEQDREYTAKAAELNRVDTQRRKVEEDAKKELEKQILTDAWARSIRLKQARKVIDAHHMTPAKSDLSKCTASLRNDVPPLVLSGPASGAAAANQTSGVIRPPTGSARRVPIGAAASLALRRNGRPNSTRD